VSTPSPIRGHFMTKAEAEAQRHVLFKVDDYSLSIRGPIPVVETGPGLARLSDTGARVGSVIAFDFASAERHGYYRTFALAKKGLVAAAQRRLAEAVKEVEKTRARVKAARAIKQPGSARGEA
jgi:hypothetical protein